MKCTISNCGKPHLARGWCSKHYNRWKVHGDPLKILVAERGAPLRWIEANVNFAGYECLQWPFARHRSGGNKGRSKMFGRAPDRLMCELVNGAPPTPDHEVAHSCGNGHEACMNRNHLRWATPLENSSDAKLHGTTARGERSGQAKLKEVDVRKIRQLAKTKTRTSLAKAYGVSVTQICQIVNRRHWKHVDA
jgi:hypothetical protein